MEIKSVSQIAFKDISKYLIETYELKNNAELGELFVTAKFLNTKENRKLNKELGLHSVNKKNNIKNCYKIKTN